MEPEKPKKRFWKLLTILGPGLTTGAADDDPSGIATYSQTGAQFGYKQLWTALYMLPFMIAVQEACARIGLVKGKGLVLEIFTSYRTYSKILKWLALSLLACPVTAFIIDQPWDTVIHASLVPDFEFSFSFLFIIVGVFGTTRPRGYTRAILPSRTNS